MIDRHRSGCHPDRGLLINALATAGSRRVHAEEALAICPRTPERIAERLVLLARVVTRQSEEQSTRAALERWEASA